MKNQPTNPTCNAPSLNSTNYNDEAALSAVLAHFTQCLKNNPAATQALQEAYNKAYDALLDQVYHITSTMVPNSDEREYIDAYLTEELESCFPTNDCFTSML